MNSPSDKNGIGSLSMQVTRVVAPVREQVLGQLREAIVRQQLAPGQRLIERELTEQTGVSRTTIREVLRELAAEGLVISVANKGTVVASVSLAQAAELYEIGAVLESMAVRQFAARATSVDLAALRRALNGIEAELSGPTPGSSVLAAKKDFYDALFAGARNQTIAEIIEGLQTRVSFLRATSMAQPGRPAQTLAEVRAIVEALEAGDAERAAEASAFHVRQAAQTVFDALGGSAHEQTGGS